MPGPAVGAGLPALIAGAFSLLGFSAWRRKRSLKKRPPLTKAQKARQVGLGAPIILTSTKNTSASIRRSGANVTDYRKKWHALSMAWRGVQRHEVKATEGRGFHFELGKKWRKATFVLIKNRKHDKHHRFPKSTMP